MVGEIKIGGDLMRLQKLSRVSMTLALSFLCSFSGYTKDFYKYQDENGQWVFSDTPPLSESIDPEKVETKVLEFFEPSRLIAIKNNGPSDSPRLVAINDSYAPVEVRMTFSSDTRNVLINGYARTREVTELVPARSEKLMAKIEPYKGKSWRYRYQVKAVMGPPVKSASGLNPGQTGYRYPFEDDKAFIISQGFNGRFSHQSPTSRYAVDISMPEGTPILAARSGTVVAREDYFFRGGIREEFYERSNFVKILHDDGSMADYVHLELDSIVVTSGQRVQEGDLLGRSGSTGYSSGPHLHFVISQNQGMKLLSIPFTFRNPATGEEIVPREGLRLASRN